MEISHGSKSFIAGAAYYAHDFSNFAFSELVLKIYISSSQIQYLMATGTDKRILCLQIYENASGDKYPSLSRFVDDVFSDNDVLKNLFLESHVEILTPDFTLIPKEFTDRKLIDEWKKRFTRDDDSSNLYTDDLPSMNLQVAYVIPPHVLTLVGIFMNKFNLSHSISNQLKTLVLRNEGKAVYCNVQSGFLQVIFLREKQLVFANIFFYRSPEDFIYFLLAIYKQLELDPENVKVVLLGEIVKDSALYHLVYKYIRNIEFGKPSEQWKFDNDYPFPAHFYFSLLC